MGLRVCLVTPFAWSRPHDVNEHVAGIAAELRALGHSVTVLAPSTRAADLIAGRRALLDGAADEVIALGPAVPVSRRSRIGVPVGVRANLSLALTRGGYDVVHGFEPGLPSLSYLAVRDSHALTVTTFLAVERLGYPPGKAQRERLLGRIDALIATSEATAEAAAERLPGDYRVLSPGVDTELFKPGRKRKLVVYEWRPAERALARSVTRALRELPGWELVLLRTKALSGRPTIPRSLRGRARIRTLRSGAARAPLLNETAIFVPAFDGVQRVSLEDDDYRAGLSEQARAEAEGQSFAAVARELDGIYTSLAARKRKAPETRALTDGRDWIAADLHLHTSWSHDCQIPVEELLEHAEAQGLGAIAVTDHNVFGGALEAVELARGRNLTVIPGEEVKTDGQGEVIGLFLREEIPRGMSFGETVAAIRAQGGIVYLPHPFDRLHAIPSAKTLKSHLDEVDVVEVYNARLLFEAYNDEALRFARKYGVTMGAGSDAHVLQGVGTGGLRMQAFDGPEEFLASLRTAQVLRRPRSLLYLQSLKWAAQAKERVR